MRKVLKTTTRLAFLCGCGVLPLLVRNSYLLHIAIVIIIGAVAALGVRLVMQIGQWHFGQASMLAIGAYTSVLLMTRLAWGFWPSFFAAGLVSALFALTIGYPALRLKGPYFAILTLALGAAVGQIIELASEWTGGYNGIFNLKPADRLQLFGWVIEFDSVTPYYYFVLALFLVMIALMGRVDRSRLGLVIQAMRENGPLAEALGINVVRYSVVAFAVGSLFGGLIGSFSATYYGLVVPSLFGTWISIFLVMYVIVGGMGSRWGPVLGSVLLIGGGELLRSTVALQQLVFAALLLVVIRLLPGGLVTLPSRLGRHFVTSRSGRDGGQDPITEAGP